MAKKKNHEEEENLERWLLTYADLITLLMVFFIILYSMSNVDASKYEAMANSLKIALGTQPQGTGLVSQMMKGHRPGNEQKLSLQGKDIGKSATTKQLLEMKSPKEEQEFNKIIKEVKKYASEKGLSGVEASRESRGVVINLSDKVLFTSGKADLSPQAKTILDALAKILFSTDRQIKVEGHTDNVPINNFQFPSNWQLSTARATNVIMYWISRYPKSATQLSAAGYGEYRPVASNTTPQGRAKNRRVEIVVLREILSVSEPGVNIGNSTSEQKTFSNLSTDTETANSVLDFTTNNVIDYGEKLPTEGE